MDSTHTHTQSITVQPQDWTMDNDSIRIESRNVNHYDHVYRFQDGLLQHNQWGGYAPIQYGWKSPRRNERTFQPKSKKTEAMNGISAVDSDIEYGHSD